MKGFYLIFAFCSCAYFSYAQRPYRTVQLILSNDSAYTLSHRPYTGRCQLYRRNVVMHGEYYNGQPNGRFTYHYNNEKCLKKVEYWNMGVKHGRFESYSANGEREKIETFNNGFLDSACLYFNPPGFLVCAIEYEMGSIITSKYFNIDDSWDKISLHIPGENNRYVDKLKFCKMDSVQLEMAAIRRFNFKDYSKKVDCITIDSCKIMIGSFIRRVSAKREILLINGSVIDKESAKQIFRQQHTRFLIYDIYVSHESGYSWTIPSIRYYIRNPYSTP